MTLDLNPSIIKWPKIKLKSKLNVSYLKNHDLFTVENCLTSDESKAFVKIAESLGFTHQGSRGPAYGEAYRDNHRISVNDPVLADSIWQSGLSNLFTDIKIRRKVAVGLNPNIRFYRYGAGQHIAEPLVGGETVFYGSRNSIVAEVAPVEGMALFHIHGDKCMLHEGRNVSKGVKYVFRSDVVFA
ncbi:unnamed protein product [Arabidopsis arenosa]|uniref:Prolyl 4-hydroxylase alpha subunit domain-containing protein n=1 Tax=Arabidopsis arenosa TaxID=38785 RepID=A0A8S2B5L9_ARAAE|nr:unnamed protein product [Arabidopsis arenosa]